MWSNKAPRKAAKEETWHGRKDRAYDTRATGVRGSSSAQPVDTAKRCQGHGNNAGNRPPPPAYGDRGPGPHQRRHGVERRREQHPESRGEERHVHRPGDSAGPSRGCPTDGSTGPGRENQQESGVGSRGTSGRPPRSAPWPENMPDGRHPVWAVPSKDWLALLPDTAESMEVDPPGDAEEPMEVDPPAPEQSWDSRSMAVLSSIQEHQRRRRSARPAPYSSLRRHPKQEPGAAKKPGHN